jgi:hypothetical protein
LEALASEHRLPLPPPSITLIGFFFAVFASFLLDACA